jgi:hypothetical protein
MVNQSRAAGHCEGLAVVAQARFNEAAEPATSVLVDDEETIRAIMRGFATQFIPEVREEVGQWLKTSLEDKVAALANTLAEGKIVYSLGVYDEYGGHAILPYAVEYRTPEQVRIMVYDSNWPGRNRWVDVDLDKEEWSFSFEGEDPENDPNIWTGDASRMDLTSIDARNGSCPFCEGSVGVAKNALLVRSTDPDWSVEVGGNTVTATSSSEESGEVEVTPFKAQTAPGERPSYDFLLQIPITPDGERAKLNFPGTASVFALTPSGIAQISTPGNPDVPIEVGPTSFVSQDPAVTLSLAAGNLVASASGPTASLEIKPEGLAAAVTTADGQVVEVAITPETPAAKIEADPESGGIQVLAQASSGVVEKRDIAADGSVTVTIQDTPLDLNATTWEAPPGLESTANPSLPSPDERNLANPDYEADAPYVAPAEAVPASETVPPSSAPTTAPPTTAPPTTAATTTVAPTTTAAPTTTRPPTTTAAPTTTRPPTTTAAPTTTRPPTTTAAPTTTRPPTTTSPPPPPPPPTTTAPPIAPALAFDEFPSITFGGGPVIVVVMSNSPAPVEFSVSDPNVASIASTGATSAQITIVNAGSTQVTVSQSAVTGYAAGTFSRTLTVNPATQSALVVSDVSGTPGQPVTLTSSGGSISGSPTYALTDDGAGACSLVGDQLSRSSAGSCTVTATLPGNTNYLPVTSSPKVVAFTSAVHGTVNEGGSITLNAPAGTRFSSVLFASYGTPNGSPGNFTVGGCHAANSSSIVSNLSLFTTSVTLSASNDVFGDPCGGTYKRLYVSLGFEPIRTSAPGYLLYEVTNPRRDNNAIQYSSGYGNEPLGAAAQFENSGRQITRVYYRMQVDVGGVTRYVEVGFDPWVGLTARDLRIPDRLPQNEFTIQRFVENMTVDSNLVAGVSPKSAGVTIGAGRRGYLEIWPWNYGPNASQSGPAGSNGSLYDFNDVPTLNEGYGSVQVHDVTTPGTGSTLLAWNRHSESPVAEVGIGNYIGGVGGNHPDWTFTSTESLGTANWKLQISVEWSAASASSAVTVNPSACSLSVGAGDNGSPCTNAFVLPGAGQTANKFYDYGSSPFAAWVDLGSGYLLSKLRLWTADDSASQPHRNPTSVVLYASDTTKARGVEIARASISCPPVNVSPCSLADVTTSNAHRYVIVEFVTTAGSSQFQISSAVFTGVAGVVQAGSAELSASDESLSDETDQPLDNGSDTNGGSIEDAPLVGVLAMGARAVAPATRTAKRKRRRCLRI